VAEIPAEIVVGPYRYRVVVDQAAIDRAGQEARATLLGQHNPREGAIYLAPDLPDDLEAETLVHELLHTVFDAVGVGGGDGDETLLDQTMEERLVRQCSPMLLDTLRRNPQLVAYLTAD
jgi:hypothetical protein